MSTVTRSVTISAAPEKITAILLDVEDHPNWLKEVETIEVLERTSDGLPLRTRIHVLAMGQRAGYTVEYTHHDAGRFEYHLVEGDVMKKFDFDVSVVPERDGASTVTVNQALDIKWPLPGFMIDQLALKGVKDMLTSLKTKAEQG